MASRKLKEKRYNGKPMSHWKAMADKLVVTELVSASFQLDDPHNLPKRMASSTLMGLALQFNRVLVGEVIEERTQFVHGATMALASMLITDEAWKKIKRQIRHGPDKDRNKSKGKIARVRTRR